MVPHRRIPPGRGQGRCEDRRARHEMHLTEARPTTVLNSPSVSWWPSGARTGLQGAGAMDGPRLWSNRGVSRGVVAVGHNLRWCATQAERFGSHIRDSKENVDVSAWWQNSYRVP